MQQLFQRFLNTYLIGDKKEVDSSKEYYEIAINIIPNKLQKIINNDKFIIKGSCGQGNKAKIPWIAIFNKNITTSATEGLYVAYLFNADMTGFYLSLMHGITHFNKVYGSKKANKVVKYVSYVIDESINQSYFTSKQINLKAKSNPKARGYEKATIFSKFYPSRNFNSNELITDLETMLDLYDQAYNLFSDTNYFTFINDILNGKYGSVSHQDYMTSEIVDEVIKESGVKKGKVITLRYIDSNQVETPSLQKQTTQINYSKVDYIAKAKQNTATGISGEKAVFYYEKEYLVSINRKDLADKVEWLSKKSDIYGYDILSFDVDSNGTIHKKYIEVKTTTSKKDTIVYFSQNEISKSIELAEDYWVYRIFNLKGKKPYFYRIQGSIIDNFDIEPISYIGVKK